MALGMANIAPEIVSCIGEGRHPNVNELARVADRILDEVRGPRSAFSWGVQDDARLARGQSFRAALAALSGTD